jgi:hypothetical protein
LSTNVTAHGSCRIKAIPIQRRIHARKRADTYTNLPDGKRAYVYFGLYFHFFTRDHEPIHVHVRNADGRAKYEIENEMKLIYNTGIKSKDLKIAESIIEENRDAFIEEWKKVFDRNNG